MRLFFLITGLLYITTGYAQENIPLGTWRTHFSFDAVSKVLDAGSRIYAVGENGLFFIDKNDNSINTIGKIDGLQEDNISAIGFDENKNQLIIGYLSGNIDVVVDNEIVSLDLVTNSQVIGSKKINHILTTGTFAFVATDYGLLNMDLSRLEIRETYRQLGLEAEQIVVNQSVIQDDSIYLATERGVIASNFRNNTNLSDPDNWKRYDETTGISQNNYHSILFFNNKLHAFNSTGSYSREAGNWVLIEQLSNTGFTSVSSGSLNLIAVSNQQVQTIGTDYSVASLSHPLIDQPLDALISGDLIYIADGENGLLEGNADGFQSVKPSGPSTNRIFRFKSDQEFLYAIAGGFDQFRRPLSNQSGVNQFEEGSWTNEIEIAENTRLVDVVDMAFDQVNGVTYYGLYGGGVIAKNSNGVIRYDQSNSTLRQIETDPNSIFISTIALSSEGLWVLNYGAPAALHLFDNNDWQPFPLPTSSVIDMLNTTNYLFMIVDRNAGGGILVFDKQSGGSRILSEQRGNGGLPSNSVYSLALALDGQVWIGTAEGVAVLSPFGNLLEGPIDVVQPIFENRLLLRDEIIRSIKIDPGNRKWMGTDNGGWLFDENTDVQIQNFTTDNSPLPSNEILAIGLNEQSGEVFFGTSVGTVSYRSDATLGGESHGDLKVFPNPITADYQGTVGIEGLANNVRVKITDANGQLIWETQSAGGTATWNARDYNGRRANTGVYFLFSSTEDGDETLIGKILVVN